MEQLAPHEKMFVDPAFAEDANHGSIGCHECHGGNPAEPDYLAAHNGVVRDPTFPDPGPVCGDCHPDIVEKSRASLHATLHPFTRMIDARSGSDSPEQHVIVDKTRQAHCGACHSSCGQCHVSRPTYVGGGLLNMHFFERNPPWREVCTACHGSRIEKEYLGENKGVPPDVHWRKRFFRCIKCHSGEEMHADASGAANRYQAPDAPKCIQCHASIYDDAAPSAEQHRMHKDKLSCQVCHAVSYKNCYDCHFALSRTGEKFFINKKSELDFKIGLNPLRSDARPERFAVLRHVPVDRNSFRYYADNALPHFDALPTWKYATPHNIQRRTPQNAACNGCHGNENLFLLESDVAPEDRIANKNVTVPLEMIPKRIEPGVSGRGAEQAKPSGGSQ